MSDVCWTISETNHCLTSNSPLSTMDRLKFIREQVQRLGTDKSIPRSSRSLISLAYLCVSDVLAVVAETALLIVLCYTGMRLSEALGLTWNDVRLQDGFAYVADTKTDEPRAVYLPPVAVAAMANVELRGGNARVFRYAKGGHLYSLLKTCAFRASVDLPERSAFHIFRHTYATWMRRYAGLDTKGLVATGAWRDRKSADRYEHVQVSEEARKAVLLPTKGRVG
jgi:integrase